MEISSLNNNKLQVNQGAQPTISSASNVFSNISNNVKSIFERFNLFASPNAPLPQKLLTDEQQKKVTHFKCLMKEIKSTESSYQAGLQTLENMLVNLATSTTDEDIKEMASIAKNLNDSSKLFLEKLGKAENGDDFLKAFNKEDMGKIYDNFENYLTSLLGNPTLFKTKMKTHEAAITLFFNKQVGALLGCNPTVINMDRPLQELQVIPVQRMGRYGLLLTEAIKSIDEDRTNQATEIHAFVKSKIEQANEVKREFDRKKIVAQKAFKVFFKFLKIGQEKSKYEKMNFFGKIFYTVLKK